MQLRNPSADVFISDGKAPPEALARISHLGVGAHQDDLEFMAFHGIRACYHSEADWFGGVTCTNGSRSEEHTSELQSHLNLVCRLLLEKKKKQIHTALQRSKI